MPQQLPLPEALASEVWKLYRDTGYRVSNYGRIVGPRRLLSPPVVRGGYSKITLKIDGIKRNRFVHVMVAEAFLGLKPDGMQINHIDGNKQNNHINNLEYVTPLENTRHAQALNLRPIGQDSGTAVLDDKKAEEIYRLFHKEFVSKRNLALQFNVTPSCIQGVVKERSWRHLKLSEKYGTRDLALRMGLLVSGELEE